LSVPTVVQLKEILLLVEFITSRMKRKQSRTY